MIFFDAVLDLESKINKIPNVLTDKPLFSGAIAQLGERLPCTQEVSSSILLSSTISFLFYYFYSLASKPIPRLGILTSRSKLKKQCFFRAFFTLLSSTISFLFYYFLSLASKPIPRLGIPTSRSKLKKWCFFRAFFTLLSSTISFLFYYFLSLASKPIPRLGILTSRSKLKKQCFFRAFFTLFSSTISFLFYYFYSLASKPTGQTAVSVIIYNHPFCLAIRAASLRLEAFNLLIASLR